MAFIWAYGSNSLNFYSRPYGFSISIGGIYECLVLFLFIYTVFILQDISYIFFGSHFIHCGVAGEKEAPNATVSAFLF